MTTSNNELFIPFRGALRQSTWAEEQDSSSMSDNGSISTSARHSSSSRTVFTIQVPLLIHGEDSSDEAAGQVNVSSGYSKLVFERDQYEHMQRLFQIIDSAGRGTLGRREMAEFVALRCPSFRRRDEALSLFRGKQNCRDDCEMNQFCTFDEIWFSVADAGMGYKYMKSKKRDVNSDESFAIISSKDGIHFDKRVEFGLEAWMVFCRLISMLQFQEAKSHFVRHQPREEGTELNRVIVIDVHPPLPPQPLSVETLLSHERTWRDMSTSVLSYSENNILPIDSDSCSSLPPPELDLNHCLLAAHDRKEKKIIASSQNSIKSQGQFMDILQHKTKLCVSVSCIDGPNEADIRMSSASSNPSNDFALILTKKSCGTKNAYEETCLEVRRKLADFEWLHQEFLSHKQIGGTLCGRILPNFPRNNDNEGSLLGSNLLSLAKSMYSRATTKIRSGSIGSEDSSSMNRLRADDHALCDYATSIERYLNFLLDHPALSTSFPLNVILQANQAGLESAKSILNEMNYEKISNTSIIDKVFDMYYAYDGSSHPDFVRSAARAAVTLRLHGILDATGMPTASFLLQHASLPKFDFRSLRQNNNTNNRSSPPLSSKSSRSDENDSGFEQGVVPIESELDDEYDLLPSPSKNEQNSKFETSFHYGHDSTFGVGGVSVDDDIDKLREIIGSLDSAITRLAQSTKVVMKCHQKRCNLLRSVFSGLGSFKGLSSSFRESLCDHIQRMEDVTTEEESCIFGLNDAVSWQASLSLSAVAAAEDVRSAARAARTASGAKSAAELAALKAHETLNRENFSNASALKAAQVRAEMSQSHAIHAAVVNHEAFLAKRRATIALAHDIRYWNTYRKKQLLQICLQTARKNRKVSSDLRKSFKELRKALPDTARFPSNESHKKSLDETSSEHSLLSRNSIHVKFDKNVHISDEGHFMLSASADSQELKENEEILNSMPDDMDENRLSETDDKTNGMTASMQSLVDGLMVWGGRFVDPQDEMSVPSDIAAHIALGGNDSNSLN